MQTRKIAKASIQTDRKKRCKYIQELLKKKKWTLEDVTPLLAEKTLEPSNRKDLKKTVKAGPPLAWAYHEDGTATAYMCKEDIEGDKVRYVRDGERVEWCAEPKPATLEREVLGHLNGFYWPYHGPYLNESE